ncbi:MAG: hypothetical protein Q8Q09_00095 [Deltaproteobacteria bacterium]|nr:hypothetical protein [Deltaproteobacteria bacterium]
MSESTSIAFGLIGGFAGDQPKRAQAQRLAEQLRGPQSDSVTVSQVITVLETLPFAGRIEFVLKALCESPSRDRLVRGLFDACFRAGRALDGAAGADDEAILDSLSGESSRQLDPERYYLVRLLAVTLPRLGSLGVELFYAYQATRSTVLFRTFLDAMVASPVFTDDELEAVFLGTVDASRKAILGVCKRSPHRQRFVGQLIEKKLAPLSMFYWANPEVVAALLSDGSASEIAEIESLGLRSWPHLGSVYLAHLRGMFETHTHDPIRKGKLFRAFESHAHELSSADVLALVALCEEHQPLELAPSVAPVVRSYLEELSQRGAWEGPYEGVSRVLPCERLLCRLNAQDKLALLRSSVTQTARGWAFTEPRRSLCETLLSKGARRDSAKQLFTDLACEAFDAVSEEAFWDLRTSADKDPTQRALQSFEGFFDLARWTQNRLALQAVRAWLALHERTTPSPTVIARYAQRKTAPELWTLWTRSALGRVLEQAKAVSKRAALSLNRCSPRSARSSITSYVPYLTILVDHIASVFNAPGQQCDPVVQLAVAADLADATRELFDRAELEFADAEPTVGSRAVASLRASLETLAVAALRRASACLVFDPAREGYVTAAQHSQLAPALGRVSAVHHLARFSAAKIALLDFCRELVERVKVPIEAERLGFVASVNRENQTAFVFFDVNTHKLWSGTALSLLTSLRAACALRETDVALSSRVWALYKREKFGEKLPKRTDKKFNEYLLECLSLPPSVLAQEKPRLLDAGVALLKANEFDAVADAFARAGWLMEVLDREPPAALVREKYLLKHGDIADPAVRALLEEATSDRDPALRIQAHVALLNRSQHSLAALASSVEYVARRIRNEAGLHRPLVYQWLIERMAALVTRSLQSVWEDPQGGALADLGALCEALEKMLRDDVSKRDSVAKNAFRSIAAAILSRALTSGLEKPLLEARRRWVHCAVLLDSIVVRTLHGDEGSQSFVWPLQGCTMPRERTVPEAWLAQYLPFLRTHFRAGKSRFDEVRIGLYTRHDLRESETAPRFEVAHAVDLLVDALGAVAQPGGASPSARDELTSARAFPASTSADSTLLRRALALFAFARTQWLDAPMLVRFFEAMVDSLDAPTLDASQLRQVLALFEAVRGQCPQGSLWYELPLLARACERLLSASIRLSLSDTAKRIYPRWVELRNGQGRTPMLGALSVAQAAYLIAEGAVRDADVLESGSQPERRCTSACALLQQTPSAAYLVQDDLVSFRDDLLLDYTWKTRGELYGVFDPAWSAVALKDTEARARAPLAVASNLWPTLNGRTMRTYTVAALESALTIEHSPQARSRDVADFVQSPASSHVEVIALLRRLLQRTPAAQETPGEPRPESPADDGRELLLETVILCVFQTDAAWSVLAYLLSPEVIATSQRTTASILTNLHSWVAMDKVVAVLRILLEPKRRWAIQVFLHKAILRLLLDTASPEARSLFANEWAQRQALKTHADVCHEMVKLAVGGLTSPDADKSRIAWKIADEVARSRGEFGATTVLQLLVPVWTPVQQFAGQRGIEPLLRIQVPNAEVPESFGQLHSQWLAESLLYFTSTEVRDRMRGLLATVAQGPLPYLRTLATCMGFVFSPCAEGVYDAQSLAQLQALLLSMSVGWEPDRAAVFPSPGATEPEPLTAQSPEDDYLLEVAPRLFAAMGLQVLSKELQRYTEHERQNGRALSDVCQKHAAARALREVFGQCLASLASVPPIQVEKRIRLARVAHGILSIATEWGSAKPLLTLHFQEALRFLRGDVARVTSLL